MVRLRAASRQPARIMAFVGTATTKLVTSDEQPLDRFVTAHADHRRAEELRKGRVPIEIVTEGELRRQFKLPLA